MHLLCFLLTISSKYIKEYINWVFRRKGLDIHFVLTKDKCDHNEWDELRVCVRAKYEVKLIT